ncbi:MAG: hypothetical protein QOD99_518 [Chthoniobacter sp.]|jgi:hypothetical protein|nr:hypothetical protein [Chthoniobacter sp.]
MMRIVLLLLFLTANVFAQSTPAPAGKYPPLRVQASAGTHQKPAGGSFYKRTMEINPKVIIEGVGSMKPIPALDATMLVITLDTQAKYVKKKDVLKVHSVASQPIPEAANGARREFTFPEESVEFDSYRDSSNVGGEVYKYFILGLRDPASKEIIGFETNYPALAAFVKAHPEKRDEYLSIKKGAKLPEELK